MVGSLIGPYRIIRLVGEGGMGAVYEAVNESIERRVAIKVLHADYANDAEVVKRFFNEARAVNRIAHPSIVQINEQGRLPEGTAYIVMEFLDGQTLAQRLKQVGGRLPQRIALGITWQVAAALAAAHSKGIVHRDLNPNNLMLVPDPLGPGGERVKLLDFGIAKLAAETHSRTSGELIMGTPTYMSPEQCHGADSVDEKTDVYSLGTILFEMLTGRPPFVGEGAGVLVGMHLFRQPPAIAELAPQVPATLAAFTERLLIKDRALRPSMDEVLQQLVDLAEEEGGVLGPLPRQTSGAAIVAAPASRPPSEVLPVVPQKESPPSFSQSAPLLAVPSLSADAALAVGSAPPAPAPWALLPTPHHGMAGTPSLRSRGRLLAAALGGGGAAAAALLLLRALFMHAPDPRPPTAPQSRPGPAPSESVRMQASTGHAAPAEPTKPPPHPFLPLSVKLPPLRLANVQPIEPPRPVSPAPPPAPATANKEPPSSSTTADRVLSDAQSEYLNHNYSKAIEVARSAIKDNPTSAWRIIGSAACGMNNIKLAMESYSLLESAGRQYLFFVCQRHGINIENLMHPAKH